MVEQQVPASATLRKTCTGCGACNTPQWREGPAGPRTLCNACGVKHLRHVRGCPRTSLHTAVHKPLKTSKAQKQRPTQKSKHLPSLSKPYTSTKHRSKQAPDSYTWRGSADECSQPSSESAGDVCWAPQADVCNQRQDLLDMGTACAAVVNLLSMTQPQSSLQRYTSATPTGPASLAQPQASKPGPQHLGSGSTCSDRAEQQALRQQHACHCAAAKLELSTAKKEAEAADAAVDAVAQVLAAKQAAARKAKAAMTKADKRLKQLKEQSCRWDLLE